MAQQNVCDLHERAIAAGDGKAFLRAHASGYSGYSGADIGQPRRRTHIKRVPRWHVTRYLDDVQAAAKVPVLILQKHGGMKGFIDSVRTTTLLVVVLSAALVTAQTNITPPANSYTPAQDVQLGREAA